MKVIHNADIQQISFLDERFYMDKKTELFYPSVTTILDVYPKGYGYIQWLKDLGNNADEVLRRAGEQGSNVHSGIERFLAGQELRWIEGEKENYTLDEWMMILKFVEFYKTFKPKIIAFERTIVSPELGFGGTLDLVCEINGEIWYIDHKSGNGIYKSHKIQAAAYQRLWNKTEKEQITRIGCLHLRAKTRGEDKLGKTIQGLGWKVEEAENIENLNNLFDHATAIWKEENPNPKPKNLVYPDSINIKDFQDVPLQSA